MSDVFGKKPVLRNLVWIVATALIVFIDQLTKRLVVKNMELYDEHILIPGFFNLNYVRNRGAGLGILADARWVFIVFTAAVIVIVVWLLAAYKFKSAFANISLVFILGGGIGNMIDRLAYGEVVDFFQFQIRYFDFIFNVADIFVTFGTLMFAIYYIFMHGGRKDDESGQTREN